MDLGSKMEVEAHNHALNLCLIQSEFNHAKYEDPLVYRSGRFLAQLSLNKENEEVLPVLLIHEVHIEVATSQYLWRICSTRRIHLAEPHSKRAISDSGCAVKASQLDHRFQKKSQSLDGALSQLVLAY